MRVLLPSDELAPPHHSAGHFKPPQGPTLSELVSYAQAAVSLAGSAWTVAISPFAIFGTDRWGLNVLFYFAVLVMGFNLIIQAPKQ